MKRFQEEITLTIGGTHTLIRGNKPTGVCLGGMCDNLKSEANKESMLSMGLFGGSVDPNKFYPNIDASEWTPTDSDFINPVFRGLSETTVIFMGVPLSFAKPGVLKASMPMAKGITINTNHDTEVENAIGAVADVAWQEGYTVDGVDVPAGINIEMKIDAKSNPRIARGILMDPPSVHSNSMTVKIKWEKSHPEIEDFWDKLGSYDKDGNLIQLVVTEITNYQETSLVSHGADPFSQQMVDSKILSPGHASRVYSFSLDNSLNPNIKTTDMEFTEMLTALGFEADQFKDMAELSAHISSLITNQIPEGEDISGLKADAAELTALKAVSEDVNPEFLQGLIENQLPEGSEVITPEQTVLLGKIEELGGIDKVGNALTQADEYLESVRLEAVNAYKLTKGDKAQDFIVNHIMKADLSTALALKEEHEANLEALVPLTCQDCQSTNVSRTASLKKEDPGSGSQKSFNEKTAEMARRKRKQA